MSVGHNHSSITYKLSRHISNILPLSRGRRVNKRINHLEIPIV